MAKYYAVKNYKGSKVRGGKKVMIFKGDLVEDPDKGIIKLKLVVTEDEYNESLKEARLKTIALKNEATMMNKSTSGEVGSIEYLQAELERVSDLLEKKEAENFALHNEVVQLTAALVLSDNPDEIQTDNPDEIQSDVPKERKRRRS